MSMTATSDGGIQAAFQAATAPDERLATSRVLICDDQPLNTALLEEILSNAGYTDVRCTTDPREAITLIRSWEPDLVLLDLMMPHLDGFQVMGFMADVLTRIGRPAVLVLTGDASPATKHRALACGADDFLTKPLDDAEVLLRARNLLSERQLRRELAVERDRMELRVRERTAELAASLERESRTSERLREVDAMKTAFLEAISHEVRSPMTVIAAVAAVFERQHDALGADQRADLTGRLSSNVARLQRLLESMLELRRLRSGDTEIKRIRTELSGLLTRVCSPLEGTERVTISHDCPPGDIDPGLMGRLIEHLVNNALTHTAGPVDVRAWAEDDTLYIAVEDRGPGIAPDRRTEIFESFRGDDAFTPQGPPTCGLPMVAQIARLHGGRVWVEDRDGGGASFRVRLPLAAAR